MAIFLDFSKNVATPIEYRDNLLITSKAHISQNKTAVKYCSSTKQQITTLVNHKRTRHYILQ